jgi:hypothetical protein
MPTRSSPSSILKAGHALTEIAESMCDQPRDMHLRDAELATDLGLRHAVVL